MTLMRNGQFLLAMFGFTVLMYYIVQDQTQGPSKAVFIDPEITKTIQALRERVRNVEFKNDARTRELVSLQVQFAQVIKQANHPLTNTSHSSLVFLPNTPLIQPNIYHVLPHLMVYSGSLVPTLQVSKGRIGVSLVFGIPTIKRPKVSYLLDTLTSLLQPLTQGEKDDIVIVIFIGESDDKYNQEVANIVTRRFPADVESGLIEVIAPHETFYPNMDNLPLTLGDPLERVKWRSKQNLDVSYLMMYCQRKARFYIQLEDDIIALPSYATTIKEFALQQTSDRWFMLEFSSLGFIGRLFRTSDLTTLVDFFLLFYKDKPVDWLLDHFFTTKVCSPVKDRADCHKRRFELIIHFKPSLFQHVGKESSLKGKKQNLIDKEFKLPPLFIGHLNPKAQVITSFDSYTNFTIDRAYTGQTFLWCYPPRTGDVIRIIFNEPLRIESCRFKSGNNEHPGDVLLNATVEVMTEESRKTAKRLPDLPTNASSEAIKNYTRSEYPLSAYTSIGEFNNYGIAENITVPEYFGEVVELRVRVLVHESTNWIVMSEIYIVPFKRSRRKNS